MAKMETQAASLPEEIMKNHRWLDECLLKQPVTDKEFQPAWQAYKYLLRRGYDDIVPGYYMNKLHWSSVYLDGNVPQEVLADMVQASHKLVLATLSKKVQQEILE